MHMTSKDVKKLNRITDGGNRVLITVLKLTPIALLFWALVFWICQ